MPVQRARHTSFRGAAECQSQVSRHPKNLPLSLSRGVIYIRAILFRVGRFYSRTRSRSRVVLFRAFIYARERERRCIQSTLSRDILTDVCVLSRNKEFPMPLARCEYMCLYYIYFAASRESQDRKIIDLGGRRRQFHVRMNR